MSDAFDGRRWLARLRSAVPSRMDLSDTPIYLDHSIYPLFCLRARYSSLRYPFLVNESSETKLLQHFLLAES